MRRETLEEVDVAVADDDLWALGGRTSHPLVRRPRVDWGCRVPHGGSVGRREPAHARTTCSSEPTSQPASIARCERLDRSGGPGSGTAAMDVSARADPDGAAPAPEEGLRNEVLREGTGELQHRRSPDPGTTAVGPISTLPAPPSTSPATATMTAAGPARPAPYTTATQGERVLGPTAKVSGCLLAESPRGHRPTLEGQTGLAGLVRRQRRGAPGA